MAAITVNYTLNPPAGVPVPASGINSTATHQFALKSAPEATDLKAYYDSLRDAIAEAKSQIGGELTEWRDAVGKLEAAKEKKKVASEEDEDEDDREE